MSTASESYVAVKIAGRKLWLVPESEATPLFREAVQLVNNAAAQGVNFAQVKWTNAHADEFNRVRWGNRFEL